MGSTPMVALLLFSIMIINKEMLDAIEREAKENPRLRANRCLHKSPDDKVQKMINYLLPGTEMPIHRHLNSEETLTLLQGMVTIIYFNEDGQITERIEMTSDSGIKVVDIPRGQWHNVKVDVPVILLEVKEGPYRPLLETEIMN